MPEPKLVAAVVTEYRKWSHAEVILGKLLEGYDNAGKEFPNLKLVALHADQVPAGDASRALAKKHGFTLHDTVAGALTRGGKALAVDGVLLIGEHGNYPDNARGQKLYPRRRFLEETCAVFARSKKSVPVFSDKHLGPTWADARWMADRCRELFVPFLAGSSLPVTWRRPALKLPRDCDLTEAVQIGYGPFEGYGFHALEALQCLAERRKGGETGVRRVQCLQGQAMWEAMDAGRWSKPLLDAAMRLVPAHAAGDVRALTEKARDGAVFLIEYRDGFRAAVAMLNGWVHEGDGGAFVFAGRLASRKEPVACHFYLQQPDPFGHFSHLVRAIDSMISTGHAPYPVERTLLTSGILDAVMTSAADKGRAVDTPHLAIAYTPTEWPFATGPVPKVIRDHEEGTMTDDLGAFLAFLLPTLLVSLVWVVGAVLALCFWGRHPGVSAVTLLACGVLLLNAVGGSAVQWVLIRQYRGGNIALMMQALGLARTGLAAVGYGLLLVAVFGWRSAAAPRPARSSRRDDGDDEDDDLPRRPGPDGDTRPEGIRRPGGR